MANFIFRSLSILVLLGVVTGLTACGSEEGGGVVTTVGMIADVARNVAGNCLEVSAMMGPGIDPHLYKASASDVRTLQNAAAILYGGYVLEGQLGEVLGAMARDKPVVAVSEASLSRDELIDEGNGVIDPHVWMNVAYWARTIAPITEVLSELEPDCAAAMSERAAEYRTQLEALNSWVIDSIASIPAEQRILVTAHDAFAYYGRAYAIDIAAIQGISTASEASLADIRGTVDTVVERNVPAMFVESSINPRTVEAVLQAVQDRGGNATIGGQLFSDAMGEDGTAFGTYIGMIYSNTTTITEALGGVVVPLPDALNAWAEKWDLDE